MQLPPSGGSGTPLLFPTSLTFTIWMRPQGGSQIIVHKDNAMQLGLSNTLEVFLEILNPATIYLCSSKLTLDQGVYLGIAISFNTFTSFTSVQYYIDGKQSQNMYAAEVYIEDESRTAPQTIGATVGLKNFYTGFIWKVEILNYVSSIVKTDFAGARQPLGLSFQLFPCSFLQTINCVSCGGTCIYGCIRQTDCSLCLDPLCQLCSDFTSCDQCIFHASNLAACHCDFGYILDAASRTCNFCSPECANRNGLTSSSCLGNAQLAGNSCVCLSGYFPDLHPGQ